MNDYRNYTHQKSKYIEEDTLDLHGVDVSYEIVDGVAKIVISNDKVTEQAVAEQTEATTRTMAQQPLTDNAINTASVAADS